MSGKLASIILILLAVSVPSIAFAHDGEDHGDRYHIDVVHVMESGFHGKLDGKVVEVVLSPDAILKKDGQAIKIDALSSGDSVFVKGVKMPGNKIGAKEIEVEVRDAGDTGDHSKHPSGHGMQKGHSMKGHKMMEDEHGEHVKSGHGDHK